MDIKFDISGTVTLKLDNKKYHNKHLSDKDLKELLDDYLYSCACTCECEVDKIGSFDNINISNITIDK